MGFGINEGLLEVAVTVRVCVSFGAPEEIPVRPTLWANAFSLIVTEVKASSVGGVFTGFTVTVKVRVTILLLADPSLTVTVITDEPKPNATGVNVSVPVVLGLE